MFEGLNMGNLGQMIGQMQEKAQQLQGDVEKITYTAKSGGGLISATVNGKGEVVDLSIDDSLMEDKEALQILVIGAVNEAIGMSEAGKRDAAMRMMGDLASMAPKS